MATETPSTHWFHLRRAANCLNAGGVLAYPTEAVWGLGCDPFDEAAVSRLLAMKQRPMHKGLILVAASTDQISGLLSPLPAAMQRQATDLWSDPGAGPVTILLPDPEQLVPEWIRGDHDTVAVRVSAHPLVKGLCEAFGGPVVSTSCNPGGRAAARTPWQVQRYFRQELDGWLPGAVGTARRPSRILDLKGGRVLRA